MYSVTIPILSLIIGLLFFFNTSKSQSQLWKGNLNRSKYSRMMNYILSLGFNLSSMQEIRIFNLSNFLTKKFDAIYEMIKNIMNHARKKYLYFLV